MTRGFTIVLSIGLFILWITGVAGHASPWLTWLDGLAAIIGFAVVLAAGDVAPDRLSPVGPIALGVGLGILWIIGLTTGSNPKLTWWTFGFACAFVLVGIVAHSTKGQPTRQTPRPV
jgi:hypothetical protein